MKKEDTKNHIMDTAISLFWQQSYHGVNMNELSRVAGVNKATVYQHFASKEVLAVAALKRAADRTEDFIYKSTFAETDDPVARLNGIYAKIFTMHSEMQRDEGRCRGCPFVNLGMELSTSSDPIRLAVSAAFETFQGYYVEISGDLDKAATLMATMNGCLVASKIENRPEAIIDGQKRALQVLVA